MVRQAPKPRYVKVFKPWISHSVLPLSFLKEGESEVFHRVRDRTDTSLSNVAPRCSYVALTAERHFVLV